MLYTCFMAHKSIEELAAQLAAAELQVEVGANYAHYKHPDQPYTVTLVAISEATEEVCVIYTQESGARVPFIRPLASFLEMVEVDGVHARRFQKI